MAAQDRLGQELGPDLAAGGERREELTARRTQAVCRLHRLLAEPTPGGMRRELSANKAQALLARIRRRRRQQDPGADRPANRAVCAGRAQAAFP